MVAYTRRREQIEQIIGLGLEPVTNVCDVCDCEFVITMLPDDIHISMSTASSRMASKLANEHTGGRQGYVVAFGNPDAASAHQLFIIAAGAPADLNRCQPIFDALGQQVRVARQSE